MTALLVVTVILIILSISAGLFVIANNYRLLVNRRYFILNLTVSIWIASSVLPIFIDDVGLNENITRLITPSSTLALYAFLMFCFVFPKRLDRHQRWMETLLAIPVLIVFLLSYTDHNVRAIIEDGEISYEFGALYYPYVVLILGFAVWGVVILFSKRRLLRGLYQKQVNGVLAGVVATLIPLLFTGIILPILGVTAVWDYSHLAIVAFLLFTAYSITRYRLFEIRLLTTRTVAYLMALVIMVSLSAFLITTVSYLIFGDGISFQNALLSSLVAVILMLFFQPLKKLFDYLTSNIFYRDSYAVDDALDELSKVLAAKRDVDEVIDDSLGIIRKYVNPISQSFVLVDKKGVTTIKTNDNSLDETQSKYLLKNVNSLVITDNLEPGRLFHYLKKRRIEAVFTLEMAMETIGFIALGAKRNGDIYNQNDIRFLNTSAKTIAISISDALSFYEIEMFNITLQERIKKATQKLTRANKRLRVLDKTKDDFISAASHQLRPQLAAAKGFVDMTHDEVEGELNDQQKESLKLAAATIDRMTAIVGNILETSISDKASMKLNFEQVDIVKMVLDEVSNFNLRSKKANITIHTSFNADNCMVTIDEVKIREAIANLIANAIEYGRDGGYVKIDVMCMNRKIKIIIEDDGLGISKQNQNKVFNKYARTEMAISSRPSGTGLGLYVSRQMIESHGGTLTLTTSQVNEGSTFVIEIPIMKTK